MASVTVAKTTCGEKRELMELLPKDQGKIVRFVPAKSMEEGFEDTLWYGKDHFSLCHHLEGRRVEIIFKPLADKPGAGEILRLQVCDDLPISH
jgi:hypothetical protein